MKFNKYLIVFTLFLLLLIGIGAVNAVSDNSTDNVTSEIDSSILQNNEGAMEEDLGSNNESNVESSANDEIIKQDQSSVKLSTTVKKTTKKSNLTVVTHSNFVKKGGKYYLYLVDEKGNSVANKKLSLTFNGKILEKTTDKNGKVSIDVDLSKSASSVKVDFKGDTKYNAFSKRIYFYIENSLSIVIGNSRLLTNGYLRVYLRGPVNMVSHKSVKITIGKKVFTKETTYEGFLLIKPKLSSGKYNIIVKYDKYKTSKKISCVKGDVVDPLKVVIPPKNGVPDVDRMPKEYIMGNGYAKYTLLKSQYLEAVNRDSYSLYLYGKLSKYTFFKVKTSPNTYHIMKREKWNVIERALNTEIVKKNKYSYWPQSITVSLNGKSYTYSEVRDIQNTEVTCGATSASVCTQALRNFHSEKFFQVQTKTVKGVNIPVLKAALDRNGFKTEYFNGKSIDNAIKQVKSGAALVAFLPRHYVSIIDVSPDGSKVLVSNSYGDYNVGGLNKVPTGWVSLSYFKTKFANTGLIVRLDYKLSEDVQNEVKCFYLSMRTNWQRQNTNEKIPEIGL